MPPSPHFSRAFSSLLISALIFTISPDESIGSPRSVHYCSDWALDARVACRGNGGSAYAWVCLARTLQALMALTLVGRDAKWVRQYLRPCTEAISHCWIPSQTRSAMPRKRIGNLPRDSCSNDGYASDARRL